MVMVIDRGVSSACFENSPKSNSGRRVRFQQACSSKMVFVCGPRACWDCFGHVLDVDQVANSSLSEASTHKQMWVGWPPRNAPLVPFHAVSSKLSFLGMVFGAGTLGSGHALRQRRLTSAPSGGSSTIRRYKHGVASICLWERVGQRSGMSRGRVEEHRASPLRPQGFPLLTTPARAAGRPSNRPKSIERASYRTAHLSRG